MSDPQKCPKCGRALKPLFTSLYCPICDEPKSDAPLTSELELDIWDELTVPDFKLIRVGSVLKVSTPDLKIWTVWKVDQIDEKRDFLRAKALEISPELKRSVSVGVFACWKLSAFLNDRILKRFIKRGTLDHGSSLRDRWEAKYGKFISIAYTTKFVTNVLTLTVKVYGLNPAAVEVPAKDFYSVFKAPVDPMEWNDIFATWWPI